MTSLRQHLPVERLRNPPPVVAVLRLAGVIGQMGPWRRGLGLATLAPAIERAFRLRRLAAVALAVNSPGGSPVQAALIAGRIRALADEKDIPVFAFAEDVAASGGYWLAVAADEVFAHENSIVGSIGVITQGFGLAGFIERFGIERRLYTAGKDKAMLDPFLEEKPADVERLKAIQEDIHDSFKRYVQDRRRGKLKGSEEELFSGAFWTGRKAFELGLVDGIGDVRRVMRERFGDKVRLRPVGPGRPWWRRRAGLAASDPGVWTAEAIAAIEERLMWNRFGL